MDNVNIFHSVIMVQLAEFKFHDYLKAFKNEILVKNIKTLLKNVKVNKDPPI